MQEITILIAASVLNVNSCILIKVIFIAELQNFYILLCVNKVNVLPSLLCLAIKCFFEDLILFIQLCLLDCVTSGTERERGRDKDMFKPPLLYLLFLNWPFTS